MLSEYPTERENTISTKSKASVQSPTTKKVTHFTSSNIQGLIVKGGQTILDGWWSGYLDYTSSGYDSVRAYATASAKLSTHFTMNTINQNIGLVKWAVEQGYKKSEFTTFSHLSATRNPKQAENRHIAKASVASTVTATTAQIATAVSKACRASGVDAETTAQITKAIKASLNLR